MSRMFQIVVVLSALSLGPVLSQLNAQSDCSKGQGTGARVDSGTRHSSWGVNSGIQSPCKWVNCTGSVWGSSQQQGSFMCDAAPSYDDACNDNRYIYIRCGCNRRPECLLSGRLGSSEIHEWSAAL